MNERFLAIGLLIILIMSLSWILLGDTFFNKNLEVELEADLNPEIDTDQGLKIPIDENDESKESEVLIEEVVEMDDSMIFLLMGVDANSIENSKGTRTDTMMLTRVDFDTGSIDILSIPRDTRTMVKGRERKINHAHALGGPEASVEAVKDLLDIDLEYFVKVDYKVVEDFVDTIGGVVIDVPIRMKYDDPTAKPPLHIDISKGEQTLYGKDSVHFLRFRSGYKDADISRIKAQQYFMKELAKQSFKPKNLIKLPSLIESYFENVETNIPMRTIAKGVLMVNKLNPESINAETIPGVGRYIGGASYWIYSKEKTDIIVENMFKGKAERISKNY